MCDNFKKVKTILEELIIATNNVYKPKCLKKVLLLYYNIVNIKGGKYIPTGYVA